MKTKPFSLEYYLADPSQKVVTRDGREVRIICTDRNDENPIVALINEGAFPQCPYIYNRYGKMTTKDEDMQNYDLFFADEEEELSEFESKLADLLVYNHPMDIESAESIAKKKSKQLIDLARKEIEKEDWRTPLRAYKNGYEQGKQDALKDLPKWKKWPDSTGPFIDDFKGEKYLYLNDYVIKVSELEKLPMQ